MSDLYEKDILIWSENQANLLRRRAAGELVNDAELDWSNIAEEIESVGANSGTPSSRYCCGPSSTCSRPRHGRCPVMCRFGEPRPAYSLLRHAVGSCRPCDRGWI